MRPAFAVLFVLFFTVLFIAALLISRVVNTAGDPAEIAGVINDADLYDFAYDRVLEAVISDVSNRGLTVETGLDGPQTLEFDDPERARTALKAFIETVLPREYVKQKVEETLNGVVPYASGRSDSFEIDLETSERINDLPEAVRVASGRIGLGDLVVTSVLVPVVRDLSDSITNEALGITLTPTEAEDAARRILPPDWIESQIFSVVDQAAPYFAGTEDDLDVVITFQDRVPVAGQILKDKLNDEDTLVRLVFEQVVDPLVANFAADSTIIAFGIEITESDLQEAVEIVAPADWVREQGDGIIDAVVAWLVGATETLEYTLELEDRKIDAAAQLDDLALRKLDEQLAVTPVCQNPTEAALALNNALSGAFPSCLPDNSSEVVDVMRPVISGQISNFALTTLPDQITYSDADLRAQLGPDSLDTLDTLRDQVINGVGFSKDDLINQLASDGDPQSVADANELLDVVRAGFVFDQTEITDRLDTAQLSQFDEIRGYISLGWTFRWIIFLPAILVLIIVSLIGGRGWSGRAKWAGAPVAIVSIFFFVSIQVGWASTAPLREFEVPADTLSLENRAEFPALAALVYGDDFQNMAERVGSAWISSLAMSAVPWAVAGLVAFALGFFYPRYKEMLPESLGGPGGSSGTRRSISPSDRVPDADSERADEVGTDETLPDGQPKVSKPEEAA